MNELIYLVIGLIIGTAVVLVTGYQHRKNARKLAQELVAQAQSEKLKDLDSFLQRIKESFDSVSLEALNKSLKQHLEIAKSTLSEQSSLGAKDIQDKKDMISQTYNSMKEELDKVSNLMKDFEKDRLTKYGELSNLLTNTKDGLNRLQDTTSKLTNALASAEARGNWGERIAEDVLKLAGFVEGINYFKQQKLQNSLQRPDFTFTLPNDQKINMDVKFPFDNYWLYLKTDNNNEKDRHKKLFLKDVKNHIKQLTSRDYINPDDNTIDMVIMFIPNEQVYSFINENDITIMDDAVKNKVALCSPLTLFAILAIIRQAIDNFNLERTADRMLSLIGNFNKQWEKFTDSMNKMGKRIEAAQEEFNHLVTTRRVKLQKPLDEIENLRQQKNLPVAESNNFEMPEIDSLNKEN